MGLHLSCFPDIDLSGLVFWQARIWMVGSFISWCLVEMILMTAFAVDVAAAVGDFSHLA